ncbi:ABC transporter permease [Streptomyces sp. NPDC001508]|uniref:ABC transporter permease n=1 Tax=Streptomyces sp. NPDC001508 TaxID=3154656 RepID=UPI0033220C85
MSFSTLRDRWVLFAGAVISLAVGVALTAAALQIAASAATPPTHTGQSPPAAEQLRTAYDDVATVMIMAAMLTIFLTVFIVATTFAFTVAQRRRDLALLRLVGAGRSQVRRLLLGEALLLGGCGTALGIPLSIPAIHAQMWLLGQAEFLPDGFNVGTALWPTVAAAGAGLAVAVLGVLAASRSAARVQPLEALRSAATVRRAMTPSRWVCGLGLLACAVVLVFIAPYAGLVAALALSLGVAVIGGIALTLLSPLAVPLTSRLIGLALRGSILGTLAEANLRHAVRRSASTAAPLIVLVALFLGLAGTLNAVARATDIELRDNLAGDLVVRTTGAHADRVASVPGVADASPEFSIPMTLDLNVRNGSSSSSQDRYVSGIVAVDPDAYRRAHRLTPLDGSLGDLSGRAVAVTQRTSDGDRIALGQAATAHLGNEKVRLRLVAVLPERLSTSQQILVPRDLVPPALLTKASAHVVVHVERGVSPAEVAQAISDEGIGTAATVAAWAADQSGEQQQTNQSTLVVLMGLSGLYTAMAAINAVVMGASARKREFAVIRMTGLSRPQVIRMALVEAATVTTIGLMLGSVVVAGALAGIAAASASTIGTTVIAVPWHLTMAVFAGAYVVIGATSALTALTATRPRPIRLAAARE